MRESGGPPCSRESSETPSTSGVLAPAISAIVGAMSMLPATSSYVEPGVIPGPRM